MMTTVLVIVLVLAGQLPAQTYKTEFHTQADCNRAKAAFMRAFSEPTVFGQAAQASLHRATAGSYYPRGLHC
jgi:hypothetical protein